MNVGELRKALEGVRDDTAVLLGYNGWVQESGDAIEARTITPDPAWTSESLLFFIPARNQKADSIAVLRRPSADSAGEL